MGVECVGIWALRAVAVASAAWACASSSPPGLPEDDSLGESPSPPHDTTLCAILSAIVLGGLLLNALVGWWWADSVAALAMVPLVTIEGVRALRGEPPCGDSCGGACHTEG